MTVNISFPLTKEWEKAQKKVIQAARKYNGKPQDTSDGEIDVSFKSRDDANRAVNEMKRLGVSVQVN